MTVTMLRSTAEWLCTLNLGDFTVCETVERMAWIVRVLRMLPDAEGRFPHGKWATIQAIEEQIDAHAERTAREVGEENK